MQSENDYIPNQVESCMQVATLDANGSMEIVELELRVLQFKVSSPCRGIVRAFQVNCVDRPYLDMLLFSIGPVHCSTDEVKTSCNTFIG